MIFKSLKRKNESRGFEVGDVMVDKKMDVNINPFDNDQLFYIKILGFAKNEYGKEFVKYQYINMRGRFIGPPSSLSTSIIAHCYKLCERPPFNLNEN